MQLSIAFMKLEGDDFTLATRKPMHDIKSQLAIIIARKIHAPRMSLDITFPRHVLSDKLRRKHSGISRHNHSFKISNDEKRARRLFIKVPVFRKKSFRAERCA